VGGVRYEYTGSLPFTGNLGAVNYSDPTVWVPVPAGGPGAANAVAPGDEIVTVDTTVGWLSRGISYATTAYGGALDSTFTVYSNHASLKLLGEGGNNTFVIRAFQLADNSGVATSNTLVQGGTGNNDIEYNVNAPVTIDGGRGYNTVVVLGTGGVNNFVVTKDGVMGDGLFVRYTNVQKVEVDGGGGTSNFYVLSTDPEVVTILDGGNGHSTFNVAGDVTGQVIALNPDGTSAAINHSVSSTDPLFAGAYATPAPFSVSGPDSGQVQVGAPANGLTLIAPASGASPALAAYTLALTAAPPAPGAVWYVTVAAAPTSYAGSAACEPPTSNVAACGQGLLLSADGGLTWAPDLVLTFDSGAPAGSATDWHRPQTILVKAQSGAVVGGDATLEVMQSVHSSVPVASALPGYDAIPISSVDVHVIDGNAPGLVVSVPGGALNVVENGLTGSYTVALTKAPAADEVVQVALSSDDPRVRFASPTLIFTAADWNLPQSVTVLAVDATGTVEGVRLSRVLSTVTSLAVGGGAPADAVYEQGVVDNPNVLVNVYDADSGGVVVLPTGTGIVSAANPSGYTLQLTRQPTAPVLVSILSDGLTLASSSDPRFSPTGGLNGSPVVTFSAGDWNVPIQIVVSINPNPPAMTGAASGQPVQVFPAQPHITDAI
jgi:hypothetical protein